MTTLGRAGMITSHMQNSLKNLASSSNALLLPSMAPWPTDELNGEEDDYEDNQYKWIRDVIRRWEIIM